MDSEDRSGSGRHGYPHFVDPLPLRHMCQLCSLPMLDPYQTPCGHRLCKPCLDLQLLQDPVHCPYGEEDCEQLTRTTVYPDYYERRTLKKTAVYCPYRSSGCTENMPWRDLEKHLEACTYHSEGTTDSAATLPVTVADRSRTRAPRIFDCSFLTMGCRFRGTAEELTQHCKEECAQHVELLRYSQEAQLKRYYEKNKDHETKFDQVDRRLENLEISYDGVLLWKIRDYRQKKADGRSPGGLRHLDSEPFYTSRHGYHVCARVYLNGDGMGWDTHMSLYFIVMRGGCDVALEWPFQQQVSVMLVDPSGNQHHKKECFQPDLSGHCFQRPQTDMNVASGCPLFVQPPDVLGKGGLPHRVSSAANLVQGPPVDMRIIAEYPMFATHLELEEEYLQNDEIILKIKVHPPIHDAD